MQVLRECAKCTHWRVDSGARPSAWQPLEIATLRETHDWTYNVSPIELRMPPLQDEMHELFR
jgi:hypothetical protein